MSFLRLWRKDLGKTQSQLASLIGENPKTYSSYERGASPIPPETLGRLRRAGYEGPTDPRMKEPGFPSLPQILQEEFRSLRSSLSAFLASESRRGSAPCLEPNHIREAWKILSATALESSPKRHQVTSPAVGEWLTRMAAELAKGTPGAKAMSRRKAELMRLLQGGQGEKSKAG